MKLVTVAQMQAIEREADAAGFTYERMMEQAGTNLALAVAERYRDLQTEGVLGLAGSGNNGGDTLVALASLAAAGWMASAYLVRPRPEDDPLLARLAEAGGRVYQAADDPGCETLSNLLQNHAVLLDGVLGTGFRLPLKAEIAGVLKTVRDLLPQMSPRPQVVAVDVPSGVDCDSGGAAEECIPADMTVTMAAVKQGLLKFPGYRLVGELKVVDIGLPDEGRGLESWQAVQLCVPTADNIRQMLPARPPDAHKGTFGTAVVAAGSLNYTGAALLAGEAAYRSGAGLVTLAVPAPLHTALAGRLPEATWLLLPHETGVIAAAAAKVLGENLERATALLLGPGFGMETTTRDFLGRLLGADSEGGRGGIGFRRAQTSPAPAGPVALPPLVIDADGLKHLAAFPEWPGRLPGIAVLTPHPGEMAVLTGMPVAEIQSNRIETAVRFSQEWGHVVVLKGAFTVVAAPDGEAAVIPVATAALARAGTGDVLAGLIVGLRAQGVDAFTAALAGAWIHAQAGLKAAGRYKSTAAVLAGDVLAAVPEVLADLG